MLSIQILKQIMDQTPGFLCFFRCRKGFQSLLKPLSGSHRLVGCSEPLALQHIRGFRVVDVVKWPLLGWKWELIGEDESHDVPETAYI